MNHQNRQKQKQMRQWPPRPGHLAGTSRNPPTTAAFQTRSAAVATTRPASYPRYAGRCRRPHPSRPRGKTKGSHKARGLDVALNHRLASWRVAAAAAGDWVWTLDAGVPASAAVEYLSGCLGWENETDGEDEDYGEPATNEELVMDLNYEADLFDMRMWGMLGAGGNKEDVMELEQEEEEEEEEQEQFDDYEKKIKWKKRQQKRKKMKRKKKQQQQLQKRKKDSHPASVCLCDKTDEEEMEQEEHPAVSYHHVTKMKRTEERTLDDDDDNDEEKADHMEPGEMEQEEIVGGGEGAAKERQSEEVAGGEKATEEKEREELEAGEVEEEGPDDDFGFCKVEFVWGYVDEEDWCVVGGGRDVEM